MHYVNLSLMFTFIFSTHFLHYSLSLIIVINSSIFGGLLIGCAIFNNGKCANLNLQYSPYFPTDYDERLEDEDFDLIEENLGVKVERVSRKY